MSFLLVAYLFLNDGTVVTDRFPHAATSMEACQALGKQKVLEMRDRHKDSTNGLYMCIAENPA